MTIATTDFTSLLSLSLRQMADQAARTSASVFPNLHVSKATGTGLVMPALVSGDASNAPNLYRGIFEMGGCRVILRGASVFSLHDVRPASFDEALHAFDYLHDLDAAKGQLYRVFARGLITEWLEEKAYRTTAACESATLSRRVINWVQCAPFLLAGASRSFETSFLASLTAQLRLLMRKGPSATLPADRLVAAIALAYGSYGTIGLEPMRKLAMQRLASELDQQVLADGGHISRNAEVLCEMLSLLMPLRDSMQAAYMEVPEPFNAAVERMLPMLRLMQHADGRLAVFQGVSRTCGGPVKAILERDKIGGRPVSNASLSGFARLAHGHTTILMDTGQPAAPGTSRSAAASPLALELCDGAHRIVVNCGKRPLCDPDWQQAARLTSAHSTICLDETNTGRLYGASLVQKLFGNAALLSRGKVEADVTADTSGSIISAQHSCYDMTFGLTCQRSVFLSADGYVLRGEDRFVSSNAEAVANMDPPFKIRFHLHPSVKATLSRDGASIMLLLPNKTGWKFSARGGRLSLEPSIYLPDTRTPRPTEQIVVSGMAGRPDRVQWAFKRIRKQTQKSSRPDAGDAPQLPLDAG
jgi:uncharacterized heparinase superfamily protein